MSAYYNEIDKFAAAWLRELIKAGLIADGEVDERDIRDVSADDVRGFTQCHWFAGIGGWSYALRLAGWPDARSVWTGSCPCQPFSSAGKGASATDPRHLWPAWFRLIRECRPDTIFGEQVASPDGRAWLDLICDCLETSAYALGAVDLCAAGVGAPHIRQRLYFVADAGYAPGRAYGARGFDMEGCDGLQPDRTEAPSQPRDGCQSGDPWGGAEWIACRDGKARPVEPGTCPLVTGLPGRVGRLRGYGNSIVPQVAAAFIEAYCDVTEGLAS